MRTFLILAALPLLWGCEKKQLQDRAGIPPIQSDKEELAALTLHIEGIASYTNYASDGAVRSSFDGWFSLATDFSKWNVRYIDDQQKTEQETTFDGNYTYTLYANFPLAKYQVDQYKSGVPVPDHVIVRNGQYESDGDIGAVDTLREPVSLFGSARVAWMSALACGLISNPPPQLIPPWLVVASPEAFSYTTRYESIANRDCCAQIEFITSQKLVEARFRVLSWTNVQNRCVPLEAEIVRFWFPDNKATKPLRSVINTKVSKHYFSAEAISLPVLSKKTYVTDTRFKTSDAPDFSALYALTNQAWADKDDPRLVPWVEQSKTNYLRMKQLVKDQTR